MAVGLVRVNAWIAATDLPGLVPDTGIEVVDREGRLLRAYTVEDGRWRLPVRLAEVDPGFIDMLVTYEDRRFRTHSGVDLRAFARAGWQALWNRRIVSGGSTLTMQVARLLEDSGTGAWGGKLRQIRVALALERVLSKDEILTLYLHLAPYGGNLEGIRAASLTWFGTEPRRLTAAQSALLVALPQAPNSRRPDRFRGAARLARNRVLDRAIRFGALTETEITWARRAPIPSARRDFPALAPHLADRVVQDRPTATRHDLTLDAELQARMETLAAQAVQGRDTRLTAAIMVMDHRTGALRASVGAAAYSDDTRQGFVDMTQALRSPGSTLKPLIYGLGFEAGLIHPESLIEDRPIRFGSYAPQNFDNAFRGELSVRRALQASLNIPVVSLLDAIGPAELLTRMRRAGMRAELPPGDPGLAIGLGGLGTRMEDLMQLYAMIARGGNAAPLRIRTEDPSGEGTRVLSPVAAWYLGDILSGVTPPPNAPRNRLAYKTGTSYGHRDAWAFGFDGRHVVGVWLGRADGASVPGAFGADIAAPLLFEAFARLGTDLAPLPPPPLGALTVPRAELPPPLRRFRPQGGGARDTDAPEIAFPPDGAVLAGSADLPLLARVDRGTPPFTWLWNGRPVATGVFDRQVDLGSTRPGFVELTVIDAEGRAERGFLEIAR
ncbi:penicillin-binding protein 1C [Rhodophyticola sp. CCM32]|nr:penicillin-binding protein 1C [Rhodophyticola sp. CCM32]